MPDDTVDGGARYWAFISYSHSDAAFGRRLHRRLERYSLPRRLVGRASRWGRVPKRLVPIFRDREELPAANDLTAEVREALKASRSLIIVCSPTAAASPWVAREVEAFRQLHPDRPVLPVIAAGEPAQSFPAVLRQADADGIAIEPLASDFRRGRDGAQLGLLKIVAGIIGFGLDELVQRDAQRRYRRVMAVTVAALVAMLTMAALTVFALNARGEAERQRGEAEGLVEFMLTDLRDRLKGVGRLDVLSAVNARALRYYSDQDLDRLPPDSLERRARILHAMGEDDETRGDENAALAKFREARRTTAALLAAAPSDPERIFDHAQSEYWIGYADYARDRYQEAKLAWLAYKQLADRMIAIAPRNPKFQRELGYADNNLCLIALKPPKNPTVALQYCSEALAHLEIAARQLGPSSDVAADLATFHAWLADAYLANNDDDHALSHRLVQEKILTGLMESDPKNMNLKKSWIALQRILAYMTAKRGQQAAALARLQKAVVVSDEMIVFDPANKTWIQQRSKLSADIAKISQMKSERKMQ